MDGYTCQKCGKKEPGRTPVSLPQGWSRLDTSDCDTKYDAYDFCQGCTKEIIGSD